MPSAPTLPAAQEKNLETDPMTFFKQPFNLILLTMLYFGFFTSRAEAYLDPGTGSFIIQMIVAGVAGSLFLLKTYWQKLKNRLFGKNDEENHQTKASDSKKPESNEPQS